MSGEVVASENSAFMREVIASVVGADQEKYSKAIMGKENKALLQLYFLELNTLLMNFYLLIHCSSEVKTVYASNNQRIICLAVAVAEVNKHLLSKY